MSAVTQLQSEAYVCPCSSTNEIDGASRGIAETGREGEEGSRGDEDGGATGGGMFSGVGEFSSTANPQATPAAPARLKDLNMKYAKDAMLR